MNSQNILNRLIALLTISLLCVSCDNIDNKSTIKDKTTYIDTITNDWYSANTILENIKPQQKKNKYPDGKTKVDDGKTNEQIEKVMYIETPTYKEMNAIYLFYKEYYKKRANQLNNQVTLYVTFYNKRISKKDADTDNYNYDSKIDNYMCGNFIFNYLNDYYFEGNFKKK